MARRTALVTSADDFTGSSISVLDVDFASITATKKLLNLVCDTKQLQVSPGVLV
jgi:hypothetical protein